jgi:hypothetical protein
MLSEVNAWFCRWLLTTANASDNRVKGHQKTQGLHKSGNDRADELAVAAKKEVSGERTSGPTPRDIGLPY